MANMKQSHLDIEQIKELISIGFCQPKFYKQSVWRHAKIVMEWLCDNTDGRVTHFDYGKGKGKYQCEGSHTLYIEEWANKYFKFIKK